MGTLRKLVYLVIATCAVHTLFQAKAAAQSGDSYAGKTVTMLIGSAPGGGTDASGRLIAPFLAKYLPGQPAIVVRNMPGADGMTALNYFVQQTKPDGLMVVMGSASQVDPINYRKGTARYDPATFRYVGGVGRGGTVLLIDKKAETRLYDHAKPPVIMGSNSAQPRQGMQVTLWGVEFLGWNVKWVVGYPGTNEVMLALERGEVEMTSTGNMFQIQKLLDRGTFSILNQSGAMKDGKLVPRPDFGNSPLFTDQMNGKIHDATAIKAFDYWLAMNNTDKWLALAPGTPNNILNVYRAAFRKAIADPAFSAQGKSISEDFTPMSAQDMESIITTLVGTPDEATEYTKELMRKQGMRVE